MSAQSIILFAGRRYYLDKEGYYRANSRNGNRRLHRDVWEAVHGPIPPGFVIHHKVADLGTVDADDLECLTPREHNARHVEQLRKNGLATIHHTWRRVSLTCIRCGTVYLGQRGLFCSKRCKGAFHYHVSQARRTGTRSTP